MTRTQYNSVAVEFDPLQNPHFLPLRYTNTLQNHVLLAADSIQSSQDVMGMEAANAARPYTSPLMVPERPLGGIADRVA